MGGYGYTFAEYELVPGDDDDYDDDEDNDNDDDELVPGFYPNGFCCKINLPEAYSEKLVVGVEFASNASKVKLNNAKILLFDKVKFKTLKDTKLVMYPDHLFCL